MLEAFLEEFQSNNKSRAYFKQYKKENIIVVTYKKSHDILCVCMQCGYVHVSAGTLGAKRHQMPLDLDF